MENTLASFKEIKTYVQEIKTSFKETYAKQIAAIQFVIVQVGDVVASNRYVRNKIKDCDSIGMKARVVHLPETVSEKDLLNVIYRLNEDENVTAFMVQFPLPSHINTKAVQRAIDPKKDADGFNPLSTTVSPCTPSGIITYLLRSGYQFKGKNAVVIGRSDIVGKPAAKLLTDFDCNVTLLHSKTSTEDLRKYIAMANLVIVATGHINTLTKEDFNLRNDKTPLVIFDVGINFDESGKLVGDCESNLPATFQSPVPGGVGLLTRLQLLENIIILDNYQRVFWKNERE